MPTRPRYDQPGIEVRADGAVRVLTLNQPDTLNAFTEELHEQFVDVWADVEADAGAFELVTVDLGRLSSAIPASQHLEVWVVADATSESDLVLAYDAGLFDSGLWIST